MKRGLLLIDRGSREREASEELDVICEGIKAKGDYVFTDYCFLEVEPPYIEDGIAKCLKQDIDSLTIVPYFLYPGKKIKNAVTDVMKFQKDTQVKFLVTKQMSNHKTLVDVVENRIATALKENKITLSNNEVDVMVIGHGSKDPNAQRSLDYIVNELNGSYRNVSRCWLEIEQPDIFEGIKKCEKDNPKVLIIVFYFLHEGAHVKTDINNDLVPALEKSSIEKAYITKHIG
ncbi:MAG: sirohydrochlorin chelatase, partial [Nitrosopumilus sp.]